MDVVVLVQGVVGRHQGVVHVVGHGVNDRQLVMVLAGGLKGAWAGSEGQKTTVGGE